MSLAEQGQELKHALVLDDVVDHAILHFEKSVAPVDGLADLNLKQY